MWYENMGMWIYLSNCWDCGCAFFDTLFEYFLWALFRKGVFEGSLPRFGSPFGSSVVIWTTLGLHFGIEDLPFRPNTPFLHFIRGVGGMRRSLLIKIYIYIYIYIYYVCIYIYIYIWREREREVYVCMYLCTFSLYILIYSYTCTSIKKIQCNCIFK